MNAQIVPPATQSTTQPATATVPAGVRRLVLAGFMGAGKTTVGRLLADRLGWEFVDLDALIEARAGMTVPAIFATHGEAHFRRLESNALVAALGRSKIILALGGGAPENLTNRLLLEQTPGTITVFLDAPFPALFDRCMLQALTGAAQTSPEQARPLLADPAAAEARFAARQPIYRRLASLTIATADQSPAETVAALLDRLPASCSSGKR